MLIYATYLEFIPATKLEGVLSSIAPWFGKKTESFFKVNDLLTEGRRKFKNGASTEIRCLSQEFPKFASIRLTHADTMVSGRQWIVEVGVKQDNCISDVVVTVLLKTSEISALVITPVQPTRPSFVETLIKNCVPSANTLGVREKILDENSGIFFKTSIEDTKRDYPFVIISPKMDGNYLFDIQTLCSLLRGIAEVVVIPPSANTYELATIIGKDNSAWRGAVNLVMPKRRFEKVLLSDTLRLMPDQLLNGDAPPETVIFSAVTHRTNLPLSWRHISQDYVRQQILRHEISKTLSKLKNNKDCKDCDYITLLSEADNEIASKSEETANLVAEIEINNGIIRGLEAKIEGLSAALSGKQSNSSQANSLDGIVTLRDAIGRYQSRRASVEDVLRIVTFLYSDRITSLDTAYTSARRSKDFKYPEKVYELLWGLATDYWTKMKNGEGDAEARKVFGTAFAANEKETLSAEGKKRRTFMYEGESILMERHLKIGIKESDSETLRVHFEWDSNDQKVIIGYCGPHIPF